MNFQPGGRKPTANGRVALEGIAKVLGSDSVIIEVHTDFCDNDLQLSAERGASIVDELVKLGVARERITIVARGHRDALVPKTESLTKRAANRRVVFRTEATPSPPSLAMAMMDEPLDTPTPPTIALLDESMAATDRPLIGLIDDISVQLAWAGARPVIGRLDDDRPAIGLLEDDTSDTPDVGAPAIGLID